MIAENQPFIELISKVHRHMAIESVEGEREHKDSSEKGDDVLDVARQTGGAPEETEQALPELLDPEPWAAPMSAPGVEPAETEAAYAAFVAARQAVALRARELIDIAETDDEVESAIQLADDAMHDNQTRAEMLEWCLSNEIRGVFLGYVLGTAWVCPKTGSLISGWGFDRESIEDAFYGSHPRGLMSLDTDYNHWRRLRRKRRPITVWRGVENGNFDHAVHGFSWTSDRAIAEWFAMRSFSGEKPIVVEAQIPPKSIAAAWLYESEVLVLDHDALISPHVVPILGLRDLEILEQ
jgi:hypothetical protein